jgi:hypothetical protein
MGLISSYYTPEPFSYSEVFYHPMIAAFLYQIVPPGYYYASSKGCYPINEEKDCFASLGRWLFWVHARAIQLFVQVKRVVLYVS